MGADEEPVLLEVVSGAVGSVLMVAAEVADESGVKVVLVAATAAEDGV